MEANQRRAPAAYGCGWAHAFEQYKQTPQYQHVAGPAGMNLAGFKFIFFWEWAHRFLGRVIGIVFFVPVAWFAWKRAIPRGYAWRLAALFVLGGLQGAVGWFMVMSGLEGRTEVSPYRLSAHLLFALFLFGALIWTALDLRQLNRDRDSRPAKLTGWGVIQALARYPSSCCSVPGSPASVPVTSPATGPTWGGVSCQKASIGPAA